MRIPPAAARATAFAAGLALVTIGPAATAGAVEPPPEPIDGLTTPLPEGGRAAPPPKLGTAKRSHVGLLPHPKDAASTLGLVRRTDGGFDYTDPGHRFRARILVDGTVLFADRWHRPHSADRQHGKVGGRPLGPTSLAINPFVGVKASGPLEWIMRARQQDPAGQAKAEFLDETRDFRTRMLVGDARVRVRERLRALPSELLALWSDGRRPWTEKRRIVFQKWDDCVDAGPDRPAFAEAAADELATLRAEAAENARRTIEAFVRRHAPAGSQRAFAAAELERLNAKRRSAVRFDPYAEVAR
jgi:hypothetical protein